MNETRILIIDDEVSIRNILRINLETKNYQINEAADGKTGLQKAKDFHSHLIILDLSLPDTDGLTVLKELRSWTKIPLSS